MTLTSTGEAVARFGRDLDRRMTTFLGEVHGTSPARPVVLAAGEGAYLYLLETSSVRSSAATTLADPRRDHR